MKKHLLFLLPALALMACGGGSQGNGSDQNSDSAAIEEQQPSAPLFNYVEPQEEIAKIIWEKIQATYPDIKKEVAAAKKWQMDEDLGDYFNGASQKERYPQKTRMIFYNLVDGAEGSWEALVYYKLQCYQNNDQSWTAVLYNYAQGEVGENSGASLQSFLYKDGNLTDNTQQTALPGIQVQPLTEYRNKDYSDCAVLCDTIGFTMVSRDFWPIRYNWDGEKFIQDPNSAVLTNLISQYGSCGPLRLGYSLPNYGVAKDAKLENNTIYQNGEKIADFECTDDKITSITIYSPKIGFAQKINYTSDTWGNNSMTVPSSKPLAVGYPIKNAYDKSESAPDFTAENKDGYYVLTRRTERNKSEKRDIMISFYAKDENSNIEKIRFYIEPLQITFESELEDSKEITTECKDIWKKLNAKYKITDGLGEFHNGYFSSNGFSANFLDNGTYTRQYPDNAIDICVKCYMFKKLTDGSYIILTQKGVDIPYWVADEQQKNLKREFAQYIYKNGTFTQTEVDIPQTSVSDYKAAKTDKNLKPVGKDCLQSDPSTLVSTIPLISEGASILITLDRSCIDFRAKPAKYEYYGEFEDDDAYSGNYETHYFWDGENFIPEKQYDAKGEQLALEIYSKIPAEDLSFDYKSLSKNDIVTDYDFEGKKIITFFIGIQNFWQQKNKMKMEAIPTGVNNYDVFYLTQTSASAPKKFLKYTYNNGTLAKASISKAETDSLTNDWSHLLKNDD
ncbi:MAG: hypothetical protein J6Z01_01855 [Bacteroidales bacterium]|nr:hypothetical protein [Bacteroidales bacterium]